MSASSMQVALKYTEAQEQDLMHLRRLFYGKLGQLARDRAALLKKLPAAGNLGENNEPHSFHSGFRNAADQLALTKEVADELCANHAEESLVYMGYGFCLFRCVSFKPCAGSSTTHADIASGLIDVTSLCCAVCYYPSQIALSAWCMAFG